MADPLSLTVSIVAIAQTVLQLYTYGKDVKGAKADINGLCDELFALKGVLEYVQLQYETKSSPPIMEEKIEGASSDLPNVFKSPQFLHVLRDTQLFLEDLQEKLGKPKGSLHQAWTKLIWPFTKTEMAEQMARIERTKSFLMISMLNNNLEYSRNIYEEIRGLKKLLEAPPSYQDHDVREEGLHSLLESVAPVDPRPLHQKACNLRLPNTGTWFLTGSDFKSWASGDPASYAIWMTGKSGAGKTVMLSAAVEKLRSELKQEIDGIANFYCIFNDAASQDPINIVGSFIVQLVRQKPALINPFRAQFSQAEEKKEDRTLSQLTVFFSVCCKSFDRVFLFLDAINECTAKQAVLACLEDLHQSNPNVFFCLTSTELLSDPSGKHQFRAKMISLDAPQIMNDVQVLVETSLQQYDNLAQLRQEIKDEIRLTLIRGAHGMFRWVQCQIDLLAACRTPRAVRKSLSQLPKTIEDTYAEMLQRISDGDRQMARNALMWLSYSIRPLSLSELSEAIVMEDCEHDIEEDDRLPDKNVIFEICRGLVASSGSNTQAVLAHFSVKTYLTSESAFPNDRCVFFRLNQDEADNVLATQLLRYLMLPISSVGYCPPPNIQRHLKLLPLLSHAANYWPLHVQRLETDAQNPEHERPLDSALENLITTFFATRHQPNRGAFGFWLRILLPRQTGKHIPTTQPLYYASSYGLRSIVRMLLAQSAGTIDLDARGGRFGGTALQAACHRGHFEIAKMLLDAGAAIDKVDLTGLSPLNSSTMNKHHRITALLRGVHAVRKRKMELVTPLLATTAATTAAATIATTAAASVAAAASSSSSGGEGPV